MRAEILEQKGNILTVKLYDDLGEEDKNRYEINDRLFATLELYDPESITVEQRRHIYALIGDMEAYTGYPEEAWERFMKRGFMHYDNMKELPSIAVNQMSKARASKFIEFIIVFCIKKQIPFRKDQFYLPRESSNYLFWATNMGNCVICGSEKSDLHHATDLVGMGNDRTKKKHWDSTFISLCREHHNEAHNLGLTLFMEKWIVKPIKLNERQYKKIVESRRLNRRVQ